MDGQFDLLTRAGLAPVAPPAPRRARAGRAAADAATEVDRPAPALLGLFDPPAVRDPASAVVTPIAVAPAAVEPEVAVAETEDTPRPSFGAWLLAQKSRAGLIGALVDGARRDPAFPKAGDPDAVRDRLETVQADGDAFAALDAAEREWRRG